MKRLMLTAIVVTAMGTPTRTSELASLSHATEWINSPPLTAEGLRGRVVLVQFWNYSCLYNDRPRDPPGLPAADAVNSQGESTPTIDTPC